MGHQSEIKNRILGYSERGIINSLIFSIGEDNELMGKFIGLIGIDEIKELGKPTDYEILLEQSFSDFGDADLIIIIKYENPLREIVLFIEGKVKTYQRKYWDIKEEYKKFTKKDKYNGSASNLFFQLYLKSLLMQSREKIILKKDSIIEAKHRTRKIGNNDVVFRAFKKLLPCETSYYIGLIPSTDEEIKTFKKNDKTGYHYLSWKSVHEFCKSEKKLKKVLDVFDYNEGQIYKYHELME
jgi:hypothetical protein